MPDQAGVISADIDRPKLERSLKRFAKDFGETNAQALVRWSVNACRELAVETQVWGKTKTKAKQEGAMIADAYNVLLVMTEIYEHSFSSTHVRGVNKTGPLMYEKSRVLNSPSEVNEWIEINRTRRRARTAKLPWTEKKVCSQETFKKAMKARFIRAGMAKGAWLGAGQEIARAQKGQERVNIGKNFLSYAQKHGKFGSAIKPRGGWKPFCEISNRVAHSSDKNVLTAAAPGRAFSWSLKKTVKWYSSALRRQDKQQKP